MRAIVSCCGGRRWISGLFARPESAQACFAVLPAGPGVRHELVDVPVAAYPVFALQTRGQFTFFGREAVSEVLGGMPDPPDGAEPAVFRFKADYCPTVPGRDELGRVWHVHLDAARLAELRRTGFEALAG